MDTDVILKRFEQPDEVREFELGKFELVTLGGMTIGRATYQPGWKGSVHVGAALGQASCHVEHVGMVVSGRAIAAAKCGFFPSYRLSRNGMSASRKTPGRSPKE